MPGDGVVDAPADFPIDERACLRDEDWPRRAFIEGRMSGDPTNWWASNDACVHAMLRSSGFHARE